MEIWGRGVFGRSELVALCGLRKNPPGDTFRSWLRDPYAAPGVAVLRPYEKTATPQRRWMGSKVPRICAGNGLPCPYETIRGR